MRLFVEMRRRGLLKAATAYLAVTWLTLEIAHTLFNIFELPHGGVQLLFALLVVGFPLVMLGCWQGWFGRALASDDAPGEHAAHGAAGAHEGPWLAVVFAAVALFAVAVAIGVRFFGMGQGSGHAAGGDTKSDAATAARAIDAAPGAAPVAAAFKPPPHSVAVLAFVNLSGDPKEEYFSDGLSEELLSTLVRVRELQVAGRTSAFSFKGSHTDIPTVGRKLNVAAVLEGSVRRSGDRVRVSAQLVDTVSGFTLWSETLNRAVTDVLALQTDIAARVARALKVTLVDEQRERLAIGMTQNPRALDAYFRGLRLLRGDGSGAVGEGLAALNEAIALDPRFARAYEQRAAGRIVQSHQIADAARRQANSAQALADAERAIELTPGSGSAHESRAYVLIFGSRPDLATALRELDRARALEPGDAHIQAVYAMTVGSLGRPDALDAADRAVALDPLNPDPHNGRAAVLYWQRRYAEGLLSAQTALRLDDHLFYRSTAFMLLYALGRDEEALELTRNDTDDWQVRVLRAMVNGRHGHRDEARAELKAVQDAVGDDAAYQYAAVHAQWGEPDEAMKWLETAVRVASGTGEIRVDPLLDSLRPLPRFQALEARVNLPR